LSTPSPASPCAAQRARRCRPASTPLRSACSPTIACCRCTRTLWPSGCRPLATRWATSASGTWPPAGRWTAPTTTAPAPSRQSGAAAMSTIGWPQTRWSSPRIPTTATCSTRPGTAWISPRAATAPTCLPTGPWTTSVRGTASAPSSCFFPTSSHTTRTTTTATRVRRAQRSASATISCRATWSAPKTWGTGHRTTPTISAAAAAWTTTSAASARNWPASAWRTIPWWSTPRTTARTFARGTPSTSAPATRAAYASPWWPAGLASAVGGW